MNIVNDLKKIGISFLYILGIILILTLVVTIFHYFNLFHSEVTSIFKMIIPVSAMLVGGIIIGKQSDKKGWLEGIKLGFAFLMFLMIFNYLALRISFQSTDIIYYIILIVSTIFGSMIGINLKKEKK